MVFKGSSGSVETKKRQRAFIKIKKKELKELFVDEIFFLFHFLPPFFFRAPSHFVFTQRDKAFVPNRS